MEAKLRQHTGDKPSQLPYQLIKHITSNFDESRILGSGGFGTVYKGVYDNGGEIAVKVLHNSIGRLDGKEFQKEFDNLRGLKHPNIVKLVGFCNESEEELGVFQGKQVPVERLHMALCFEYAQEGSLQKHISDENTGFNWHTRYKIIKGVCQGLKYLREGLKYPVMHFDLKPDNILLDKKLVPKIADFGLSELFGEENTKKTMNSVGTIGYWPPEYVKHQIISREFDIFSLGVVILKIMTGHEGYNSVFEKTTRISIKLVHERWRTKLRATLSHTSLEVYCNQVKICIKIALDCLKPNQHERPTIQSIVSSLNETETIIGDRGMHDAQFNQEDGQSSTLPSGSVSMTINFRPSSGRGEAVVPKVMPLSLVEDITGDFCKSQLIGWGQYGNVYKGDWDGQVVAVKWLNEARVIDKKSFQEKVTTLVKLHHQNIVQLIGYCYEEEDVPKQHDGKQVVATRICAIMCFEYSSNGSLDQYIVEKYSRLDWPTCYRIIKGICEGLKYMHKGLEIAIFHLDLKPSNILLDGNMIPKIGDYGMQRILGEANPTRKMREMERTGHMPPEFINKQIVSAKFDIYSLGVIILKLMTGNELYSRAMEMPPKNFIDLAHKHWRKRVQRTVDVTSVERYCQQIRKCLEIAFSCVEVKRHDRPGIGSIVHMLNETEARLIPGQQIHLDLKDLDELPLLDVHPLEELCFTQFILPEDGTKKAGMVFSFCLPFAGTTEPIKMKNMMSSSSCSLQLKNRGGDRVAFMLVPNIPKRYWTTKPLCGIVPPRSIYTLTLTMPKQLPSDTDDFFTLYGIAVGKYVLLDVDDDSINVEYDNFFKNAIKDAAEGGDEVVQEVKLKVICDEPAAAHPRTSKSTGILTAAVAQQVSSIDVHPTEPWIMTKNDVGNLRVWDYNTMATLNSFQLAAYEQVRVAKFIKQEKWLVAGDRHGSIHVYSYQQQQHIKSFEAHDGCITTLAAHPTDRFLLSSSSSDDDHLIKLWGWDDKGNWKCTRTFLGHTNKVTQVTFHPEDKYSFASVSWDGTVKIWSICSDDPNSVVTLKSEGERLLCVDYFTRLNQQHLVVGCKDKSTQIWKLGMNECVYELEGHARSISAVKLHPELSVLITGSLDGTVRVWDSTTYKLENVIGFNLGAVYAFGYIKGSRRIVVGCYQGIATVEIPPP